MCPSVVKITEKSATVPVHSCRASPCLLTGHQLDPSLKGKVGLEQWRYLLLERGREKRDGRTPLNRSSQENWWDTGLLRRLLRGLHSSLPNDRQLSTWFRGRGNFVSCRVVDSFGVFLPLCEGECRVQSFARSPPVKVWKRFRCRRLSFAFNSLLSPGGTCLFLFSSLVRLLTTF